MNQSQDAVVAVRMPQVNPNDEELTFIGWKVADGSHVTGGQIICEVETSKSVADVPSPAAGVIRQAAQAGEVIRVGQAIAWLGASLEAIDARVTAEHREQSGSAASRPNPLAGAPTDPASAAPAATAGAIELARRAGVNLGDVQAGGRIRTSDVQAWIDAHQGAPTPRPAAENRLPSALQQLAHEQPQLSAHQWSIVQRLGAAAEQRIATQAAMDVDATQLVAWIAAKRAAGLMTGVLPALLRAAALAIREVPSLACCRNGRSVYRYNCIDLAFTARSRDGRLFTPVVREVDTLALDELAARCSELSMQAFRGQLAEADLLGACMTVSALDAQGVRWHIGLQNAWQSAILTCGAIREELHLLNGAPVAVPALTMALSYDHGLMDGWDAAQALQAARDALAGLA